MVTVTNAASSIDLNDNLASGFTASAWVYADSDGEGDVGQIFQKERIHIYGLIPNPEATLMSKQSSIGDKWLPTVNV